jgi:ribonuclease E
MVPEEHHMLSQDPTDQPQRTESGTGSAPDAGSDAGTASTAPVVTRRTRKAPAKKAAPAPDAAPDAATDADAPEAPAKKAAARRAPAKKAAAKRAPAKKTAEPTQTPAETPAEGTDPAPAVKKTAGRKSAAKAPARKTAAKRTSTSTPIASAEAPAIDETTTAGSGEVAGHAVLFQAPVATTTRRTRKTAAPAPADEVAEDEVAEDEVAEDEPAEADDETAATEQPAAERAPRSGAKKAAGTRSRARKAAAPSEDEAAETTDETAGDTAADTSTQARDGQDSDDESGDDEGGTGARRRRRRGGRRRRKGSDGNGDASGEGNDDEGSDADSADDADSETDSSTDDAGSGDGSGDSGEGSSRRRRRRRRSGDDGGSDDDAPNTVTRVRKTRSAEDQITAVAGSTRLEAKKQRRREGREAGRRRAPIVSEAEFLARRESVERIMVIRQRKDLTQIAVLEDKVLVEHYVARESQTSLIGNVYLGRVQNVLPSMEAAFIDIGKGRNAVLYAGEVNWSALGHKEGQARKVESVLSSGQMILVQVTKDPIGHKGARLTSQVSLAGRFLVYVPDGTTSGISRKLPDTERSRLKTLLKEIVPDTAGVIVRTAAEGASEEELTRDVERLKSRWEDIEKKAANKGSGPQLLYGEPDLTLKVVRDLFTEDFSKLVIEGEDAWNTVHDYVESVAPDLAERVQRFERRETGGDVFSTYRIDEQIHKGLDRKVWLPSGGSLVIDRTEAMTVVDVNTGKFTGSGGNLEETVTKNNLEAAEEIVRQLRLRDIGGIIVVDFIDMVLESNRDLVVRRLVECLGRDRTRHQVAEVTSLGLVQMTRKRIGTGLLESFSENCAHCQGRGVVIKDEPVDPDATPDEGEGRRSGRRRGRRGANGDDHDSSNGNGNGNGSHAPSPKDVAAMARHEKAADAGADTESDSDSETEAPSQAPSEVAAPAEPAAEAAAAAPVDAPTDAPAEDAEDATDPEPEPDAQPDAQPGAQPALEAAPAEDEKPRVVTRTRRRSASRPAGPPALPATTTNGAAGTLPETGVVEPGTVGVEPGEPHEVAHVPIKKKGSRKR